MIALFATLALSSLPPQLTQLLEAAEKNNLDRRISAEQLRKAQWDFRQSWLGFFPTFAATGAWTNNQYAASASFPNPATGTVSTLVIVPKDQLDMTLRAELVLLDATKWARVAASGAVEDAANSRDQLTQDMVRRQVSAAFYNYAGSLRVLDSANKSLQVAEEQLKLQKIRAETGAITELDLARARAERARNVQTVADASAMIEIARRTLETLTGTPPPSVVELPEPDLSDEQAETELEPMTLKMPSIRAAELDLKAQSRVSWAARLTLVPTVTANFTERFTNATGFQGKDNLYSFGVSFLWRFDVTAFAAMKAHGALESAAELGAEKSRMVVRDQLHADYQRFLASRTKVRAADEQKKAASRAAEVARSRYQYGAATQIDLIQAERDLFIAEVSEIQAVSELGAARVAVRISAGQPL